MYKVSNCYKEFISNREVISSQITPLGLVLKFLWKNPDEYTLKAFLKEPFFHLYFKDDIMFLLLKFEGLRWIDIPCSFKDSSTMLFSSDLKNFPCRVLLANSNTGKLYVDKLYFMPEGTSKAFIQAVHMQKTVPEKTLSRKINSIQSSFSSCELLRLSLGKIK